MSGALEARTSAVVVPRPARPRGVRASVSPTSVCVTLSKPPIMPEWALRRVQAEHHAFDLRANESQHYRPVSDFSALKYVFALLIASSAFANAVLPWSFSFFAFGAS